MKSIYLKPLALILMIGLSSWTHPLDLESKSSGNVQAIFKIENKIYCLYKDIIVTHANRIDSSGQTLLFEQVFDSRPENVDAALHIQGKGIYLFDGSNALMYTFNETNNLYCFNKSESGSIKRKFKLPATWNKIDAAIKTNSNTIVFFSEDRFVEYDIKKKVSGKEQSVTTSRSFNHLDVDRKIKAAYMESNHTQVYILG